MTDSPVMGAAFTEEERELFAPSFYKEDWMRKGGDAS